MLETFTPEAVRSIELWELVAAALRRAIVTGKLPPGVHLQEPLLAQKFHVSRVPVREALTRLEHEGLVRSEPRRGAFVVGFTTDDVREIYDIRQLLEARAARLAAERATPEHLRRLQQLVEQMDAAVRQHQAQLVAEPDITFHREIVIMSGHRRLLAAWEPLVGIVATLLSVTNTFHRDMPSAIASHQAIVDALVARDAGAAESAITRHLRNSERVMQGALVALRTSRGNGAETASL